jgi:hypothetical protein
VCFSQTFPSISSLTIFFLGEDFKSILIIPLVGALVSGRDKFVSNPAAIDIIVDIFSLLASCDATIVVNDLVLPIAVSFLTNASRRLYYR